MHSQRRKEAGKCGDPMKDTHLPPMSHHTEEQLLLLLDGELPSREASDIQAHLQLCWECRTKSQKLQNGIYAFVNYTQECFLPKVGEPPQGWRGFGPLLDSASSEASGRRPLFGGWLNGYRTRLAPAAVAAGFAVGVVIWSLGTPPVLFRERISATRAEFAAHPGEQS